MTSITSLAMFNPGQLTCAVQYHPKVTLLITAYALLLDVCTFMKGLVFSGGFLKLSLAEVK